jgi:hypothetical protein
MRTKKRANKTDNGSTAVFSRIPLEKLSGMEETLWLEQMLADFTQTVKKRASEGRENS